MTKSIEVPQGIYATLVGFFLIDARQVILMPTLTWKLDVENLREEI